MRSSRTRCRSCATRARSLVDVEIPSFDEFNADQSEIIVLIFEFKRDLNAYLATRSGVPVGTLADVIQFNLDHADEELKFFGQELMELAEAEIFTRSRVPAGADPRAAARRAAGHRRDARREQPAGDRRADQHAGVADGSDQRRRVPVRQLGVRGGRRLSARDGDRRVRVRSAGGHHVHGLGVERADADPPRVGIRSGGGCAAASEVPAHVQPGRQEPRAQQG